MDALSEETYAEASNVLRDAAEILEVRGLYQLDQAPDGRTVTIMDTIELATFGDIDEERSNSLSPLWVASVSRVSEYLFDRAPWTTPICDRDDCKCELPHEFAPILVAEWGDYSARLVDTITLALRMAAQS